MRTKKLTTWEQSEKLEAAFLWFNVQYLCSLINMTQTMMRLSVSLKVESPKGVNSGTSIGRIPVP